MHRFAWNCAAAAYPQYPVSWGDYTALRDDETQDWRKILFDQGWLWVDRNKDCQSQCRESAKFRLRFKGQIYTAWGRFAAYC
jgi:hypothetical protein